MPHLSDPVQGAGGYAWGCCVHGTYFLYVYGTTAQYRELQDHARTHRRHLMDRGLGASLAEVQQAAEQAVRDLGEAHDEVGAARVVSLLDFPAQWEPDRPQRRT